MKIILDIIKRISNVFKSKININSSILPSQGFFYKDDFKIIIKKASIDDIKEYESGFSKEDLVLVITKIKKIIEKNLILPKKYTYKDLKSIDIVFLFFEIVKFTMNKKIEIPYSDGKTVNKIEFDKKYFNYHDLKDLMKFYNTDERLFTIDGYKFSLPSIGIENSLTDFLILKSIHPESSKYNNYKYDFTYFLGHKSSITHGEIENLIEIFNNDLDKDELKKISKIIKLFYPIQKYSLIKEGKVIEITYKIDLQNIWK